MTIGIACTAGGYKGAFTSGALTALEAAGVRADAYAGSSSSALPAAYAAIGEVAALNGPDFWRRAWEIYQRSGSMSTAYQQGITELVPHLRDSLFEDDAARLLIPANEITTESAASQAQGPGYVRLGRELLLAIRDRDPTWAEHNLRLRVFDSRGEQADALTPDNLQAVLYSTSRYLHSAWDQPAQIEGKPYLDAVYTEACPARPLIDRGAHRVLVIANDPGPVYRDFFRSEELISPFGGAALEWIQPARPLSSWGVDVMQANEAGLLAAYKHGRAQAQAYLSRGGADSWA